jgi:hypothetical protein
MRAALALVGVALLSCARGGEMPPEVEHGLSAFFERAQWVKELEPPSGGSAGAFGGGGTAGGGELFQFTVTTQLSAEEVLEHYSGQLESRGWVRSQRLVEDGVGVQTFRSAAASEAPSHALLYATGGDGADGRVAVMLRLTQQSHSGP